jgi:hypothetical protein
MSPELNGTPFNSDFEVILWFFQGCQIFLGTAYVTECKK